MRFYGLSDRQVLEMPVTRFWLLHRSVDRIAAEESIRSAMIGASVQSGDGLSALLTDLRKQMGTVVDMDQVAVAMEAKLDKQGFAALKNLGNAFR